MAPTIKLILEDGSSVLALVGDITQQDTDAIVNAANSSLMGGGGVDGAIHRAGGPAILEECKKIRAAQGPLPPGEAVSTTAGNMKSGYVIHTVGPIWQGGNRQEPETLARCYQNSIATADKLRLVSMAFPAISTGVYGYPSDQACEIAVDAIIAALKNTRHVREVRFILFDEHSFAFYQRKFSVLQKNSNSYRLTGT